MSPLRSFTVLLAIAASAACGGAEAADDAEVGIGELNADKVKAVERMALPIPEVSGLGQRKVGGKTRILAIGDASLALVSFSVAANGKMSNVESNDLSKLFKAGPSQWEAVAGDGDGRVFLLEEANDFIHVVAADLKSVLHKIKLVIPPGHALAKDWAKDENSRGEGMILLSNGHIIVAKEKNPPALVEFAPKGAAPEGFRPELALGDRAFKLPSGAQSELVATKHWLLKRGDEDKLADISDLALDAEKRLILLSDQGRAIARIERELDTKEDKIDVKAIFTLPSDAEKPEGLTFINGAPCVAIDQKKVDVDAAFMLNALP